MLRHIRAHRVRIGKPRVNRRKILPASNEHAHERHYAGSDNQRTPAPQRTCRTFRYGVPALFFYVAAQTGINSFFINYVTEADSGIGPQTAALMLSFGGMGLFMAGRLLGTVIMEKLHPWKMILGCAAGASVCMVLTILCGGTSGIAALCATYLFESVMFPTIFSMALADIRGEGTKTASSYLIMSIVGGAVSPVLMGLLGEARMSAGFVLPLMCFIFIAIYAATYKR